MKELKGIEVARVLADKAEPNIKSIQQLFYNNLLLFIIHMHNMLTVQLCGKKPSCFSLLCISMCCTVALTFKIFVYKAIYIEYFAKIVAYMVFVLII